jgi:transaldolase
MKLFLDTASRDSIKEWIDTGLIDGVTTNPSHVSKEGSCTKEILLEICELVPGDVSIEVVEKSPNAVYKQAREIAALASNVVVKIPFAKEYLPVINQLTKEGIPLNITLIFSLTQALLVAKLGVKYISPFVGRWDDIDIDGMQLVEEMRLMLDNYNFDSQLLAASLRHMMHLHEACLLGADVATIPPTLLDKIMQHPLTLQGIEKFDADWKKLGKTNLLS